VLGTVLTLLALPAALIGASLLWLPHSITYLTGPEDVTVTLDRGVWKTERVFPRERIATAQEVTLPAGSRRAGTSLPGYCAGRFYYPGVGSVWQATNCSRRAVLVVLSRPDEKVVLTPADARGFLAALEGGERMAFRPEEVRPRFSWLAVKLLIAAPVPLVLLLPAVFFVAPGKLRYAVGQGMLEVQTLFVRRRFALAGSTARRYRPGGAFKRAGSAFPGYYTGSFSLDGTSSKVFATTLKEGVLLEGERRVFVTPEEPEQFLAALAEHGANIDATASESEAALGSMTRP
jgi:hypothetical protein